MSEQEQSGGKVRLSEWMRLANSAQKSEARARDFVSALNELIKEVKERAAQAAERAVREDGEHPSVDVAEDLRRRLFEETAPERYLSASDFVDLRASDEVPVVDSHEVVETILEEVWPLVRPAWRQKHAAHLAARRVLHKTSEAGDDFAQEQTAAARLERATQDEMERARETLGLPWDGTWEETERDGMTEPDARLADYARARWAGREAVDRFQKEARERLERYRAQQHADLGAENRPPSPWRHDSRSAAGALAHILWDVQLRPALVREKASHAALAYPVAGDFSALWSPRTEVQGDRLLLHGEEVARIELIDGAVLDLLKTGRGLTMHRLVRHVVSEVYRQEKGEHTNTGELLVHGGVSELARAIGDRPSHPEDTLQALRWGQALRVHWAGGSETGGLWTYHHEKGTKWASGFVSITANAPLRPHYAVRQLERNQRILVPVVRLPPFVGRFNDHAAQADFQWLVVRELVDRRKELHEFGGVTLEQERLRALADQAGLAPSLLPRVMDRWTQDGKDGFAFLERTEGGRYHLADNEWFRGARRFLDETAKLAKQRAVAASKRKPRKRTIKRT